jgi:CRISPR-associated exonuclease Cas4
MSTIINLTILGIFLWALWRLWKYFGQRFVDQQEHNRWLPHELQSATIAFAEKEFRARSPFPVGAVVDRAYRLSSGLLVLMELKQRERVKSFRSDVVELSVQKLAIEASGSGEVASHAYVVCEPSATQMKTPIRVALLTEAEIIQLRNRHVALKKGRAIPTKVDHPAICQSCGYLAECKPASVRHS